jgi:mevalonate kinase
MNIRFYQKKQEKPYLKVILPLDKLVEIALKNRAIGAKMTGTGRGGLVIALAENEEIQESIAKAIEKEGYDAWKTMIG